MNKELKKNLLNRIQAVSREFKEIHFPARDKVQEESLAIIAASVAVSAVIIAVDTVSWHIFHILL